MSMPDFIQEANAMEEALIEWRRDFHQHPELGLQEVRTAGIVAAELERPGVVAMLDGAVPGPTILVRVDMDALPIQEENEVPYASKAPGVMHACGHDAHTAVGLAVANMLAAEKDELPGRVKFVFQPAEEGAGGAEKMVAEGVLKDPAPDFSLGVHVWNDKPFGWIGITSGPAMAGAETFEVILTGKGGHGAAPEQTHDPVVAAAAIIQALQTIVSRNVDPIKTAVVSVTMVQTGDAFNIIPKECLMRGTIRTFQPEIRALVLRRFEELCVGLAESFQCAASVKTKRIAPSVSNDENAARELRALARKLYPDAEVSADERTMGSEDMAFMMDEIPGCYIFVGSSNAEKGLDAPHHNPKFDIDEACLTRAAALVASSTWHLLETV